MIFKDRLDASVKLYYLLKHEPLVEKNKKRLVVVSLLRGGAVVGDILSKRLRVPHLPLVVTKIVSPGNEELAIGALCFDVVYLEKRVVEMLQLKTSEISSQIKVSQIRFLEYLARFEIKESLYKKLHGKIVLLVDDGIATGASARAALLFLRSKKPDKIALCVPVSPSDFKKEHFDASFIVHEDPLLSAVSQFYEDFPQVKDEEVKIILSFLSPPLMQSLETQRAIVPQKKAPLRSPLQVKNVSRHHLSKKSR